MSGFGIEIAILAIPLVAAALLAALPGYRLTARLNVAASLATLVAALLLFVVPRPEPGRYLLIDDLNIVFVVLTTFVAFTTSVFSASYIGHELETGRLTPAYLRFYHAMYQLMMFGMNLALIANNIGVMWVAIELATLSTVLMVGIYRTHEALEAAWKYFILGSVGIALALFGTILVYMAARPVIGEGPDAMVWTVLVEKAGQFDPALLNLAFVFLLLGYGTKVGLAPLHAWLPDAHAEGPTPISAVLSGLLLNVALYAVLRFKLLLAANSAALAPGPLLVVMGLGSLVFAAFMLYRRRDIKRFFAYSSIEHMGIIAFAFGMGGPLANFAGLYHMVMHSLTKSGIFFAVGHVAQVKGTQKIADIKGLTASHPVLGWSLVVGVVAIAGLPPLGVFMSEFLVVSSTFAREPLLALIFVAGLIVAFAALMLRLQGLVFGEPSGSTAPVKASYVPMFVHFALVLIAGVYMPPHAGHLVRAYCEAARMTARDALIANGTLVAGHRPWPRVAVDADGWRDAIEALAAGELTLTSEWGETGAVHMAIADEGGVAVVSLRVPDGHFPSVGAAHPPAIRLERAMADLFGLVPDGLATRARGSIMGAGASNSRSTGRAAWSCRHLNFRQRGGVPPATPYPFLPVEGESLHQIPVGPVHAGIIEPGHFRFTASGETIVRLEERLGYVHKGIDGLMQGADLMQAARLAGRVSGDSTVAYALAFARAVEAATGIEPPRRAVWLRAMMAELERIANHLGDIGAICNDAAFALMLAHCAVLRERVLRFAETAFGHRMMKDRIVPGGVAVDFAKTATLALEALLAEMWEMFPRLVNLYDNTASLQDRTVGTGILTADLARRFAVGGPIGRASGRTFDTRRALPYPPYDGLKFRVPVRDDGDVNARVWLRIREVEQSLLLLERIAAGLPDGPLSVDVPTRAGEGVALVEGFRGDIFVSVRLAGDGRVQRCHLRDPSWFQWPLLEAAIEGNIVADFPLCNKSFNCSYSGHDL